MPILDASFLIARRNSRDALHNDARAVEARLKEDHDGEPLIMVDYAFAETVTVVAARQGSEEATRYGEELLAADELTWVHASERLPAVWREFVRYSPLGLSLTDTALVAVTHEMNDHDIVTLDRRFDQVDGIRALA